MSQVRKGGRSKEEMKEEKKLDCFIRTHFQMDTLTVRKQHKFMNYPFMKIIPFTTRLLLRKNVRHGPLNVVFMLLLKTGTALLIFIYPSKFSGICSLCDAGVAARVQNIRNTWACNMILSIFTSALFHNTFNMLAKDE